MFLSSNDGRHATCFPEAKWRRRSYTRELGQVETVNGKEYVWTEVYGDGQWAKRSYNNAGTSLSGSAVLIGKLCKKPLFVGVRNSFCFVCCIHAKSESKPQHTCFKNWDKGASAMEASIMLEGFKQSMDFLGLVYKNLLDSSSGPKRIDSP
jgi:hypothetical protein